MVGLLDITKCLYEALEKLEKAHKSSKQLVDALQGMQSEWSQPANPELQSYVDIVSKKRATWMLVALANVNRVITRPFFSGYA